MVKRELRQVSGMLVGGGDIVDEWVRQGGRNQHVDWPELSVVAVARRS